MEEKQLSVIVGENITKFRKRHNLSQKELADRLDISQDAMARMEKGKIAPKMSRIQDISFILKCPPASLFREHDDFTDEKAAIISEILKEMPQKAQEAVLEFIQHTAELFKDK